MAVDPGKLAQLPWLILLTYWFVSAFHVRKTQSSESLISRYRVFVFVVLAFTILFGPWLRHTILGERFMPEIPAVEYLGVVLIWLGIALAIWARHELGEYWSARITIKVDHKLINTGPYAHFRHPIYSGVLLALVGTALEVEKWRAVVAFFLILLVYSVKARKEEAMLSEQFGDAFDEHRKHTGFLIPRF
jgi:protein-S-isoprenylcysteine O-methyltransferase Ste14